MADRNLKLIGAGLNVLALFHPSYAGKLAYDLFSRTDDREPKSDKEKKLYASSLTRMAEAKVVMLDLGKGQIATHVFPPTTKENGKTYLVVHGWGSRINYVQNLISALRATGATVVGLDLPGHGLSSGRKLNVPMALEAMHATWEVHGPFHATIGHSFGGFNLVMAARGGLDPLPAHVPEKMVLIGSPAEADKMFVFFGKALGLTARAQKQLVSEVQRISGKPVEHFSAARMLSEIDVPTLVLHAEDDKEVHPKNARLYGSAGPHVLLEWLNGLGHRRIVNAQKTSERIVSFLAGPDAQGSQNQEHSFVDL